MAAASDRDEDAAKRGGGRVFAALALSAAAFAAVAAAASLWASEGAGVFLTQAFAALAACF